jgi:hypothetical protein
VRVQTGPENAAMNIDELSPDDRNRVLAFVEVARAYCRDSTWEQVEPRLTSRWYRKYLGFCAVPWRELAPYIRSACEEGRPR